MCAFCQSNGLMAGYTEFMVSDDYPELARLFGERVAEQAEKTRIDLNGPKIQGIPVTYMGILPSSLPNTNSVSPTWMESVMV